MMRDDPPITATRAEPPAPATGGDLLDVSGLASFSFGPGSLTWWGTQGMMAIEGMGFALTIAAYLYLRSHAARWPLDSAPPALLWGSLNMALLAVSAWPNHAAKRAAVALDLPRMRRATRWCLLFSLAFIVVRVLEFQSLNCRWDTDAYGSVVWTLLGLHTVHLVADAIDTTVLAALIHFGPLEGKRFVDIAENTLYWYFVVLSWVPVYLVLYWVPRW